MLRVFGLVLVLVFVLVTYAAPISSCSKLHMIVARGSTEPQGEGSVRAITAQIQNLVSGSSSEGIMYPATLEDYQSSESQGAAAMVQAITNYAQACPDSKIALLGYSQGAQVIGDALGGGSFDTSQLPIDTSLTKNGMPTASWGLILISQSLLSSSLPILPTLLVNLMMSERPQEMA